jgi:hypothetical protein
MGTIGTGTVMNEDTNQHTGTRNMEPMEHRNGTQGTKEHRIVGKHHLSFEGEWNT